jgi:hypothetical protein
LRRLNNAKQRWWRPAFLALIVLWLGPVELRAQDAATYVWQYRVPVDITGADDLITRLESEVAKVIEAGHLAPFRALYGEGNTQYYWYEPYTAVHTLASAYPVVRADLQTAIVTYLQAEMQRYPLWSTQLIDPQAGTRRQPDRMTAVEFGSLPEGYDLHPRLFALYALWLYAHHTGDWAYIDANWDQITGFYDAQRSEIGQFYASIAGAIGMARLAHQQQDQAWVDQALRDIDNGLNQGRDLELFGLNAEMNARPGLNEDWDWRSEWLFMGFHYRNLTPEIARYMAATPQLRAQVRGETGSRYAATEGERLYPLWWMAQAPIWSRYFDEGASVPVDAKAQLFPIRAWIYDDSPQQLRQYLDVPDALIGDYTYMQALVYTIAAHGTACWQDIRTGDQICSSGTAKQRPRPPASAGG